MAADDEAFRRRVAETSAASEESEGSSGDETHVVRDDAVRAIDADELQLRGDRASSGDTSDTRLEADISASSMDPRLERPPDLSEAVQVTEVAPDGTSIGRRGLTSPTGEALGGSEVSSQIQSRAGELGGDALGGSRLDPLGMLDASDVGSPTDREIVQAIGRADGSMVSAAPIDPATGMQTGRDRDLDPPEPPRNRFEDPNYDGEHDHAPPMTGRDQDPTDDEQGDDIVGPGYAQPDPDSGYDVVTGESIAAAIKTNDPGVYTQPTEDSGTSESYATSLADNDPQVVTNYGPEGPQNVEVGDWTPPVDTLFDPPPEGALAGMVGEESAMADPAAALGGSSMIGSSTPDEAPPPPDPPPGEDPDQGPLGPPGGGGDS